MVYNEKNSMLINKKKVVLAIIGILFISSLIFPVFYTEFIYFDGASQTGSVYQGWSVFLLGAGGILNGGIGWYANIGLGIWLLIYIKNKQIYPEITFILLITAVLSLAIALSSFQYKIFPNNNEVFDERVYGYGMGFWCWIAIFICLCLCTSLNIRKRNLWRFKDYQWYQNKYNNMKYILFFSVIYPSKKTDISNYYCFYVINLYLTFL